MICGFGFGAVCLLRANMIAVWIVFCCAVLLQCIREKRMKDIPFFLSWFMAGAAIIVIPICVWLIMNNAFIDFIKDYFVFNIEYTKDAVRSTALNKYNSFSGFVNNIYVLTAIVTSCYACRDKELFHIAYLGCEAVTLLLICMSGQDYGHYGMVLVPVLTYPFSMLLSDEAIKKKSWILAFVFYFSVAKVIPVWIDGIDRTAKYALAEDKTREGTGTIGRICAYITASTDKDDRIIVWGNWNIIYVESERLPASKYSYQNPIGMVNESIMTEFFSEINETPPRAVVVSEQDELGALEDFIIEHQYTSTHKVDGYIVYMQEG